MDIQLFQQATGGHKEVPDDWVSGTGLRALIQENPALLWLKYHGSKHGLVRGVAKTSIRRAVKMGEAPQIIVEQELRDHGFVSRVRLPYRSLVSVKYRRAFRSWPAPRR